MDDETKKKFAEMEAKIAALEAKNKDMESGFCQYIEDHGKFHRELNDMIYPAYFKTHPEYRSSMDQYHDIVEGKSKPPNIPKG